MQTPIVRHLDLAGPARPLTINPPLKILVASASPSGLPQLDHEREWRLLLEGTEDLRHKSTVVIDRLEHATLKGLRRQLRQSDYHVLHFIGHGSFDHKSEDGLLVFENDTGSSDVVTGQDVAIVLCDQPTLRLVLLNACEGGRGSNSDSFSGVAQSLVQQGVPAVVAMQFEISDKAAIAFAHEFYMAMADGLPVDAALTEGRKAVFEAVRGLEWVRPYCISAPQMVISFACKRRHRLVRPSLGHRTPGDVNRWHRSALSLRI